MSVETLLGASVAPTDGRGAPPLITALVLIALAVGFGWLLLRANRPQADDTAAPLDEPLPTESEPEVAPTTTERAGDEPPRDPPPDVDLTERPVVSVQDQAAALDRALAAGSLTTDEHRVLLTALFEGADEIVGRPGPVPPPTE